VWSVWNKSSRPAWIDAVLMRPAFWLYYRWTTLLEYLMPPVRRDGLVIAVRPGVCRPAFHEHRLAADCRPGERVLDVGCGSGIVSVAAARAGAHVIAVDISPAALVNTRKNCALNFVAGVEIMFSDLFESVEGQFDSIVTHPPYVDLAMRADNHHWATSAGFVERFFAGVDRYLAPNGRVRVMFPASQRRRLTVLASSAGLVLTDAEPPQRLGAMNFLSRLLYLEIGFTPLIYTFRRAAELNERAATPPGERKRQANSPSHGSVPPH
jgi:release factor glutamine methyltransferase